MGIFSDGHLAEVLNAALDFQEVKKLKEQDVGLDGDKDLAFESVPMTYFPVGTTTRKAYTKGELVEKFVKFKPKGLTTAEELLTRLAVRVCCAVVLVLAQI